MSSDFSILYDTVYSDAQVMQHAFSGKPMPHGEAVDFFEKYFDHENSGTGLGVLAERESGDVIGSAGLVSCNVLGMADYEIGFVLRRTAWRKGYATEIGKAQLDYGFAKRSYSRLLAQVSPENHASIATIKKLGMRFHSTIHNPQRGARQVYVASKPGAVAH